MKFRHLTADEIDCRIATVNQKGVSLLLYKDARVDQNILDETFGIFGWQRSHQLIGDRLYCTISIKDPDTGDWISKQDVGTESYTEKEKGQASDSFKRAGFNWGIGRELYTAPFIWIPADIADVKEVKGQYKCYTRFKVAKIDYNADTISYLAIEDSKGGLVYSYGKPTEKYISALERDTLITAMRNSGATEEAIRRIPEKVTVKDRDATMRKISEMQRDNKERKPA
ncbi:hypothetical protein ACTNEN_09715 [Oribacterium sp. HCP28S3_H8]|uniref:hypothetical protein n=1 Tax=Oribacterium sp. HCP28S3_H8 TaxID=3438945 RepID=UPI003F89831E